MKKAPFPAIMFVAVSQTETGLKVIAANPAMLNAYKSGIPGNGKHFPDGSKIVKIKWSSKKNAESPYFVMVPDTLKSVSVIEKDSKRFPNTSGWHTPSLLTMRRPTPSSLSVPAPHAATRATRRWPQRITFLRPIPGDEWGTSRVAALTYPRSIVRNALKNHDSKKLIPARSSALIVRASCSFEGVIMRHRMMEQDVAPAGGRVRSFRTRAAPGLRPGSLGTPARAG